MIVTDTIWLWNETTRISCAVFRAALSTPPPSDAFA